MSVHTCIYVCSSWISWGYVCACKHSNLCQGKRSLNVQYHWMKDIFQNRWLKWKRICTGVILYLAFKVVFAELQLELFTSIINLSLILNSCRLRKSCSIICLSILFAYTCETCTLNDLFHWTFKYLSFQQQKTNSLNKSTKFSWNLDICKSTRD